MVNEIFQISIPFKLFRLLSSHSLMFPKLTGIWHRATKLQLITILKKIFLRIFSLVPYSQNLLKFSPRVLCYMLIILFIFNIFF